MGEVVRSLVPARLDRLPWSGFHTRLVLALGVAWVLDGMEITIAGAIGSVLEDRRTLGLSAFQVGLTATVYLAGQVAGALFFGRMSDRFGRRKLFVLTLGLYLAANGVTAFSPNLAFLLFFRFFAGTGIGGEYAAIHSAIDELIPARYRGRVDLAVSGTYWLGAMIGTASTYVLLNPDILPINVGWRVGLLIGPALGAAIWTLRRHLPESPRWLLMHGHPEEAERAAASVERAVAASGRPLPPVDASKTLEIRPRGAPSYAEIARVLVREHPRRTVLGATLMISQSFLYNAIFFTYVLVLGTYYGVTPHDASKYLFAFALGNLAGPLVLGHLFDTLGRRAMISGTYLLSGALLAGTGWLFKQGALTATTQTLLWSVIFFFASAAASSGYLTVSELFPLEIRALVIAMFFSIAQGFGALGPAIFGALIGEPGHADPDRLFYGYAFAAAMMIAAGLVALALAVNAEGRSLEDLTPPLAARG
ncbi:MFS transporter [Sphaerisporangium krabiense]|uniref:MFS family permease n=1 Tax=Sphaerisporangium krabiense TaxID=763782 RepID=A0A7W8Z947_9ACTN|nr:MFS transporter [Sphaerisporangium krabiense]MBB5629787.1 MFS family permease [Sphaerisporangium krabiense]GII63886.1 MFS transporter [Sphaerisporangium krabiense]